MKIFQFSKVKWDSSHPDYRFVKDVKSMTLKSKRFSSIGEAVAFVESQYGVEMTSCFCYIDDVEEDEEIDVWC